MLAHLPEQLISREHCFELKYDETNTITQFFNVNEYRKR